MRQEHGELTRAHAGHCVDPAVICLKWAVQRGQIPIPFSTKREHYLSNIKGVVEDPLTEEEIKEIEAIDKNCRLIKGQVFLWKGAKDWRDLWDENGEIPTYVKGEGGKWVVVK